MLLIGQSLGALLQHQVQETCGIQLSSEVAILSRLLGAANWRMNLLTASTVAWGGRWGVLGGLLRSKSPGGRSPKKLQGSSDI